MTNGSMGVVSEIKQMISSTETMVQDRLDIIYASTYHGVHRGISDEDFKAINCMSNNKAFNVLHAGLGQIFIEDTDELSSLLCKEWNQAGLRSNLISSIEMNVLNWKKLAANCAINPLTALRQCKNGELLVSSQYTIPKQQKSMEYLKQRQNEEWDYHDKHIFYQLIREVSDVAVADAQCRLRGFNRSQQEKQKHLDNFQYDELVQFVEEVVRDTSKNNSSMFQDILHKRHPTEINYLNGYVAKLGREQYGLDVSANEYIANEVDKLTKTFER